MYVSKLYKYITLWDLRTTYYKVKTELRKEFNKKHRNLTVLEELIIEKNIIKCKIKKLEHQLYD